jgi:hypothetical protein
MVSYPESEPSPEPSPESESESESTMTVGLSMDWEVAVGLCTRLLRASRTLRHYQPSSPDATAISGLAMALSEAAFRAVQAELTGETGGGSFKVDLGEAPDSTDESRGP